MSSLVVAHCLYAVANDSVVQVPALKSSSQLTKPPLKVLVFSQWDILCSLVQKQVPTHPNLLPLIHLLMCDILPTAMWTIILVLPHDKSFAALVFRLLPWSWWYVHHHHCLFVRYQSYSSHLMLLSHRNGWTTLNACIISSDNSLICISNMCAKLHS
jgi:hypothetical protein